MTTRNLELGENRTPLIKNILTGAGIALLLISVFLWGADEPKPEWGKLWMIKPLVMVPIAGGLGGLLFYFITRNQGGWRKALAVVLGAILFIMVLWVGTVLGLNGTWWD